MAGFLFRLFQLARGGKRTPTEDFVSLCVGRQLNVDGRFAGGVVRCIADVVGGETAAELRAWADAPEGSRGLDVRPQAPARAPGYANDGAVDLLLLLSGPVSKTIVIEAKVRHEVPLRDQLERYQAAYPDAVVVGLVETRALPSYPPGHPSITWDCVLRALPREGEADHRVLSPGRRELADLFADAGVGDPRLALPPGAWSTVVEAAKRAERLVPMMKAALVAMFPNASIRGSVTRALEDDERAEDPTEGWGVGYCAAGAIKGTRIKGATLGIAAGEHSDELVWLLEVASNSQALSKWLAGEDASSWQRVRGKAGWYHTELCRTRGARNLSTRDMAEVVRQGRIALKLLHVEGTDAAWNAKGDGMAVKPGAQVSIVALHEGLRYWPAVKQALDMLAREVVSEVVSFKGAGRSYRWKRDAYEAKRPVGEENVTVRAGVGDRLDEVFIELSRLSQPRAEAVDAIVDRWNEVGVPRTKVKLIREDGRVCLRLGPADWHASAVRECLVELARAGCGLPTSAAPERANG